MSDIKQPRKSISKRLRFEVFKRDSFCCQYCSAKPPAVPLEIDHIVPVSKGGKNNIDNLITACFDCNRGKSDVDLDTLPNTLIDKIERKKIAVEQHKQYQNLIKKEAKQLEDDVEHIDFVFQKFFDDYCLSEAFKNSVKKFIKALGREIVSEAMSDACAKIHYNEKQAIKYFCGICWNKIRES